MIRADWEDVVAVDVHTHVHASVKGTVESEGLEAMREYFGSGT